jgi:hypothetical protein
METRIDGNRAKFFFNEEESKKLKEDAKRLGITVEQLLERILEPNFDDKN